MKLQLSSTRMLVASILLFLIFFNLNVFIAEDGDEGFPLFSDNEGDIPFGVRKTSSGINPLPASDSVFVVNEGPYLDTGCLYRSEGPIVIELEVNRYIGKRSDIGKLIRNNLIAPRAKLVMPVYDVDSNASSFSFRPERDRVYFNGKVVPGEYLTGENNKWKLNEFAIPVEWINFAESDPGQGGILKPGVNTIVIEIDVENNAEVWCTAVDWAMVTIQVVRPVLLVHGIGPTPKNDNKAPYLGWNAVWVKELKALGMLVDTIDLRVGQIALDSIQNNAAKIDAKVIDLKRRWGFDQLNIVSHSKGGLDARHYIRNNDSVHTLIQIGTPNAGSPLADVGYLLSLPVNFALNTLGVEWNYVTRILNSPAGRQLTTAHMSSYNKTDLPNPRTRYISLAGNYFFGLPKIDAFLFGFYFGRHDVIVPLASVHHLRYAEHLRYRSVAINLQASHTKQIPSRAIFNRLKTHILKLPSPPRTNQVFAEHQLVTTDMLMLDSVRSDEEPSNAVTNVIVGQLGVRETAQHDLFVDTNEPLSITLMYATGKLDFVLISPSGIRYNKNTALEAVGFQQLDDVFGATWLMFTFENPEIGTWRVRVVGRSVQDASGKEPYAIFGLMPNPTLTLQVKPGQSTYSIGNNVVWEALLTRSGQAISGATVSGIVRLPDNTTAVITFNDGGANGDLVANDGIYTATLANVNKAGEYFVSVSADGPSESPFSRTVLGTASVHGGGASILGQFSDFGRDLNNNGLFDQLVIRANVSVTGSAGKHELMGYLSDSQGNVIDTTITTISSAGVSTVELVFDGRLIFNNAVNGPYQLSVVRVAEDDGVSVTLLDERLNAHSTSAYLYEAFERTSEIYLTANNYDIGVDTNNNGLYDFLRVGMETRIYRSGRYEWSASLVDRRGHEVAFFSDAKRLNPGKNMIEFNFRGQDIFNSRFNGPYTVKGFLIFGGNSSLIEFEAHTTGKYKYREFEIGQLLLNASFENYDATSKLPNHWNAKFPNTKSQIKCNKRVGTGTAKIFASEGNCAFHHRGQGRLVQEIDITGLKFWNNALLRLDINVLTRKSPKLNVQLRVFYSDGTQTSKSVIRIRSFWSQYRGYFTTLRLSSPNVSMIRVTTQNRAGSNVLVDNFALTITSNSALEAPTEDQSPVLEDLRHH